MIHLLVEPVISGANFSITELLTSFFQVFINSAITAIYIVFGWMLIPFSSTEKNQEYVSAVGFFIFTCIFCSPPAATFFTYIIAGIMHVSFLLSEMITILKTSKNPSVSFETLVKASRFFIYLTLPSACSGSYYINIHRDPNRLIVIEKIFCGVTNPSTANCVGSLTAKVMTYLSIIPSINPFKIITYLVYIIEFITNK
jgi:hypothetical protein